MRQFILRDLFETNGDLSETFIFSPHPNKIWPLPMRRVRRETVQKKLAAVMDELNREIARGKQLEKTILETEEGKRQCIGYDLHDSLGQLLTGISFKVQSLKNSLKEKMTPEYEDAAQIAFLIDKAKGEMKEIASGLSTIVQKRDNGLLLSMEQIVSDTEFIFNIPSFLKYDKPVFIYNETAIIHLYRIAQEAVTNAAKHAKPESIEISLKKEYCKVTMIIKDDGIGMPIISDRKKGMGLQSMNYRANLIGAFLDVRSGIDGGTVVICVFYDGNADEKIKSSEKDKPSGVVPKQGCFRKSFCNAQVKYYE